MTDTRAPSIGDLIAQRYSRRAALKGSASAAATVVIGGSVLAACGGGDNGSTSNPAPTVAATASPTTTTAGNRVTITATATDDGSVASTSFLQVGGAAVTLSATTGLTTSFTAPAVTASSVVVIRFTATDNSGNTASVDVNVTVGLGVLGFTAVAKNRNDVVTIPAGYAVSVLYRTGDPIAASTTAYANTGADGDFATRAGDHGAGFYYFGLVATGTGVDVSNSARGLLAMNHEGITQAYLHPAGPTTVGGARPEAEVLKETEAHGLSVVEIAAGTTGFAPVQASAYNRRVTPSTAVTINGPVKGNALVQTAFSADGTAGRGTIGNSALAQTAWGTALSSEEKWARYFRRPPAADDARRSAKQVKALTRYGVTDTTGLYGWATVTGNALYARWDAQATGASATADYRNEPNQFGWIVEVDPYDKAATVRKRTALGRLAHSGVATSNFIAGAKARHLYGRCGRERISLQVRVGHGLCLRRRRVPTDRMSIGDKYFDTGTLYVAKFANDGTGTWLPLTFGTGGLDAANATYSASPTRPTC